MDEGQPIGRAEVPILAGDDADALAARVLAVEHLLYPQCLARAAEAVRKLAKGALDGDPASASKLKLP